MPGTVVVTGDYWVGPGQNISVSDPWNIATPSPVEAGYVLQAASSATGMSFELDGTLSVANNHPTSVGAPYYTDDYVYGIEDANVNFNADSASAAAFSAASLARIGATGSLYVSMAAGAGQNSAYGYYSGYGYVPFENDGTIVVTCAAAGDGAYGVAMNWTAGFYPSSLVTPGASVVNTGSIDVTGGSGAGVWLGGGAVLHNSGTITAHGGASGVETGFQGSGPGEILVNSGHITAYAGPDGAATAIFAGDGLTITNSGTITGPTAIWTGPGRLDLTNTGTINGVIVVDGGTAGDAGSTIHNAGAINGDVSLSADNAYYDGRGGTLTGTLALGGGGVSTAYLGNDGETVTAGYGYSNVVGALHVFGGVAADWISGGAGDDVIDGGGGNDVLDGGGGINTVSFASATTGVTVSLALQGEVQVTGVGADTISNFQNLTGSAFSDHLTGDGQDNVIDGGRGGDDVLDGGGGTNTVSFVSAAAGVTVSLALQGSPQATGIGTDTLTHFQNLTGSLFADHLMGDANNNVIDGGGGGADVLDGAGGTNTVSFASAAHGVTASLALQGQVQDTGVGLDTLSNFQNLTGSAFDDVLAGDSHDNVIDGGAGNNTVSYAAASSGVNIDLWQGTADGSGSGHDTLVNIQGVIGSAYDDYITAGQSSGRYDGGGGTNTVDFSHNPYGMTIDLTSGEAIDGHVTITLANIQNVVGTEQSDRIILGGGSHTVTGGLGANIFALSPTGMGADEITDFSPILGDKIDLEAFHNLHTLAQVMSYAHASGADTVFDFGGGATLKVDGIAPAAFTASDFVFGAPPPQAYDAEGVSEVAFRNGASGEWGFMSASPGGGETWHDIGPTSLGYDVVGKLDFNGDGAADIAFRSHATGDLGYMSVNSSGAEVWHPVGPTSTAYDAVGAGDFNGDGTPDIAFRNPTTGDFGFMSILPGGGEAWHPLGPTSTAYDAIGAGDFNGDGLTDVAFRNRATGDLGFMSASTSANPWPAEIWHPMGPTSTDYAALQPGDFNGDGAVDLPFRNPTTGDWGYMSVGASGAEVWHPAGPTSTDYAPVATADFNGDGFADIAFRNTQTGDWGYMSAGSTGGEIWHAVGPTSLDWAVL